MKTKIHLLTALLLIIPLCFFGQSSFTLDPKTSIFINQSALECIYTYTVNAPLKADTTKKQLLTYATILQANSSVSKFWDWHSFKKDSILYTSSAPLLEDSINKLNSKYYLKVENLFTPVIIKNYLEQKYTVTDEIALTDYIYTEKDVNLQWELGTDTQTVCGYVCHKAITALGGKLWTVWFAPEIAVSAGPWKLEGLPGLILKAQDSKQIHTFEAMVIRNSQRPIYLTRNVEQIKISKKQYIKEKDDFESSNIEDLISVESFGYNLEGAITMSLDGKRLSLKRKLAYCPLEE